MLCTVDRNLPDLVNGRKIFCPFCKINSSSERNLNDSKWLLQDLIDKFGHRADCSELDRTRMHFSSPLTTLVVTNVIILCNTNSKQLETLSYKQYFFNKKEFLIYRKQMLRKRIWKFTTTKCLQQLYGIFFHISKSCVVQIIILKKSSIITNSICQWRIFEFVFYKSLVVRMRFSVKKHFINVMQNESWRFGCYFDWCCCKSTEK